MEFQKYINIKNTKILKIQNNQNSLHKTYKILKTENQKCMELQKIQHT